jgi:hypothetical protein
VRPNFFKIQKDTLFDPLYIVNPSLARVLWCIGENGFVLGWELGMAIEDDPVAQALEVGFERKDCLEKVFTNLGVQRRLIMNVTMEWKDFK